MAEKQTPTSRRSGGGSGRQAPPRRNDVIRCENCGEDYSITYKKCPFCNERPGRGGYAGGKRVANTRGGGYGGPINPIQIVGLVISLILIIAALFIVFRFFSSSLLGGGGAGSSTSDPATTSQSNDVSTPDGSDPSVQPDGSVSTPDSSSGQTGGEGDSSQTGPAAVQSITLNKSDITLWYGEYTDLVATVTPSGTGEAVTWTSSDTNLLTVNAEGRVTNVNSSASKQSVTVTASCGGQSASCIVRCNPGGTASSGSGQETDTPSGGSGNTAPVAPNSQGTIVNAEKGLNIRSGPGSEYDKVASASNGAQVTILGEENGWYRVDYGGGNTGYVSKDYVSVSG